MNPPSYKVTLECKSKHCGAKQTITYTTPTILKVGEARGVSCPKCNEKPTYIEKIKNI